MDPDQQAQALVAAQAQALVAAQARLATVFPSIVSVEWTWTTDVGTDVVHVSAGAVLHKSENYTYILTSLPGGIERDSNQLVHFHDQMEINANILIINNDLGFIVLQTEANHETSVPIQFNHEPINFSNAFCVAPKTISDFHKIQGFIPTPSCEANNMAGIVQENTDAYFIFVCQHQNTEIMKSAPVFHENSRVNGFIIQDCGLPLGPDDKPGDELLDSEAKICVKPILIEAWLQKASGDNNWREALDNVDILDNVNM